MMPSAFPNIGKAWRNTLGWASTAILGTVLLAGCASRPEPPRLIVADDAASADSPLPPAVAMPADAHLPFTPGEYRLAIGDVVEISVYGERDTVATTAVAPDGKLYYMFTDGLPAAGRKPEEVAMDIQVQLAHLFNNPHVDILPQTFTGNRYVVIGKVNYPGLYSLDATMTVHQALARAGGLAQGSYRGTTIEIASLRDSYLLRDGHRLPVDFEALLNRNDTAQDINLRPADVIYIASSLGNAREVYLMGAMTEQRAMAYRDNMTLIEVIAGASEDGGTYKPTANLKRVIILRGALADPKVIEVNVQAILVGEEPDMYLLPGDVVYVPEKPFRFAKDLLKDVVRAFVRAYAGQAGDALAQGIFESDTGDAILQETVFEWWQ